MPTLTQGPSQGDVVKIQFDPNYTNEAITLLLGTNYKSGAVLGKITATGKYKLATAAGADGAQIAAAVLLNPVDATLYTATPSALYTAAQQTADWGAPLAPGATLSIRIVQLSQTYGRGTAQTTTLFF